MQKRCTNDAPLHDNRALLLQPDGEAVQATPVFGAAVGVARRRDKLASLLDAFARQLRQSPVAEGVPVEVGPSPERFFEASYFSNRPLVLRGLTDDWPALRRWTPEYFSERFGEVEIEVTTDREGDPALRRRQLHAAPKPADDACVRRAGNRRGGQ